MMESRVQSRVVLQVQGVVLYLIVVWFQDPSPSELGRDIKKIEPQEERFLTVTRECSKASASPSL
jgi:hypothetical protein